MLRETVFTCNSYRQKWNLLAASHVAEEVWVPVARRPWVSTIPKRPQLARFGATPLNRLGTVLQTLGFSALDRPFRVLSGYPRSEKPRMPSRHSEHWYPTKLRPSDKARIEADDAGVVWL